MNIPDTSTEAGQREASVMLARLMPDWEIRPQDDGKIWVVCPGEPYATTNLYQPVFMFLAWRVLNWAMGDRQIQGIADFGLSSEIGPWLWIMPPAEAQRAWLDKILTLAIEAGMIAEEQL